MGGIHDVGGVDGFGAVGPLDAPDGFRAPWERLTCGVTMGFMAGGRATEAGLRHAIERLRPVDYLGSSYWERWASGVASLMVEQGLATADELFERAGGPFPLSARPLTEARPPTGSSSRPFQVGDEVRVREWHPAGHTRCPRYAQGRRGTVVRLNGEHPLPDVAITRAADAQPSPEPTYCVRFAATELWGEGGDPRGVLHLDLWHSYLEEAS
jgi:nitrile hydratase beta subunit